VNRIAVWLDARRPEAPAELRSAIDHALEGVPSGSTQDVIERGAQQSLDSALARPGRVRGSAFDLLSADALLTFACEAALESEEPDTALAALLTRLVDPTGTQ